MHLPFGGENRNLGWNLLPGGFVLPSGLGPEKVSSAVLVFVIFFFSLKWKIPPVSGVDFIAVFVPIAKTLVSSPSAGPRTAITVFPWQLVAASGFRIKSKTQPFCLGVSVKVESLPGATPPERGSRFAFRGWSFGSKEAILVLPSWACSCAGLGPWLGQWQEAGSRAQLLAAGQAPHPRGAEAASAPAPPLLFPSHCPEGRKDVTSLLPFCLKGMWGGRGGEKIFLAGGCAIGTISAIRSTVPLRPSQGGDASWPEMSPRSPLLFVVLAAEMHRVAAASQWA